MLAFIPAYGRDMLAARDLAGLSCEPQFDYPLTCARPRSTRITQQHDKILARNRSAAERTALATLSLHRKYN